MSAANSKEEQVVGAFVERLGRELRRLGATRASWLVAVSGGVDSMALLHGVSRLAARLELRLEVASLDHGLRAEGPAEVDLVREATQRLGLPFHTSRLALHPGAGMEAAARAARYEALLALRTERRLDFIATAHTANDQAETVLMRLVRGASLTGAGGIVEARADRVLRPLLFATRDELVAFVAALGVRVARDPMNDDRAFLRVRVRHEVLPVLEREAGPGAVRALARFAGLAAEDDACLNGQADAAWLRVHLEDGGLDAVGLRALTRPLRRRVMARFLEGTGVPVDAATIDEALAAVDERRTATLPLDLLLDGAGPQLGIGPAPARTAPGAALHGTSSTGQGGDSGDAL